MEFALKIKTDNAAFEEYPEFEIGQILSQLEQKVNHGYRTGAVRDSNGNTVGEWSWK